MGKQVTSDMYSTLEAMGDNSIAIYLLGFIYVGYTLTAYERKLVQKLLA